MFRAQEPHITPAHCDCDLAYTAQITYLDLRPDIQEAIGPVPNRAPAAPDDTASSELIGLLTSWRRHLTAQQMSPATFTAADKSAGEIGNALGIGACSRARSPTRWPLYARDPAARS